MRRLLLSISILLLACITSTAGNDLSLKTVVIDAGHGGKDPGSISKDRKTYEKTLVLDMALKLRDLIKEGYPDIKVILTRSKDEYKELIERAEIANKANANLFISIHINSVKSTAPNGFSIHLLGQSRHKDRDLYASNMNVCARENSVIMLEDDYSTKYQGFDPSDPESFIFMQLMQNANLEQSLEFAQMIEKKLKNGPIKADRGIWQDPLYVLWRTSMPGVLVELGFVSNQDDLAVLRQEGKRAELAYALYEAFCEYKTSYDSSVNINGKEIAKPHATQKPTVKEEKVVEAKEQKPAESKEQKPAESSADQPIYGVQIFAGTRVIPKGDPALMGYVPKVIKSTTLSKYIVGISDTPQGAFNELEKIRKKYPEAFAVEIRGEVISRLKQH